MELEPGPGWVPQTTARSQLPKAAALTPERGWPPTQTRRPSPRRRQGRPGGALESSCPSLTTYPQHCQKNTEADLRAGQGVLLVQKCPGTRAYCALRGSSVPPSRGPGQESTLCPPKPPQLQVESAHQAPTNICATGGLSPEEENLDSGHTPPDLQHLPTRVPCSWNKSHAEPNLTPTSRVGVLLTFWESWWWMSPNVPAPCQGPWGH